MTRFLIALTTTALLAGAAGSMAGETTTDAGTSTATLTKTAGHKAGDRSPFDVAGVKTIRRGKTIPSGYVLPGYRVEVRNGHTAVGATFRAKCPKGKTLRSFATTGDAGFRVEDVDYPGKRSTFVTSYRGGSERSGTIYAVCR
ncbi:MAG: hypothetical protein V9E83_03910 [Baekduia sp.]